MMKIQFSPEEIDQIASTPMSEYSDDLSPNSRRSRNRPPLIETEPEPEPEALQSRIQSGQEILTQD